MILENIFPALLPEAMIFILIGLISVHRILTHGNRSSLVNWSAFVSILIIFLVTLLWLPHPEKPYYLFDYKMRIDIVSWGVKLVLMAGTALTVLFGLVSGDLNFKEDYFILLISATLGMMLMISAADLIFLYLAIEVTYFSLFILAGLIVKRQKSVGGKIKDLIYGVVTSVVLMSGFYLLYHFSGNTQIDLISYALQQNKTSSGGIVLTLVLMLAGFGLKIFVIPFQFWKIGVYEHVLPPLAGFFSTLPRMVGIVVLMRVGYSVFSPLTNVWSFTIIGLAVMSMFLGNLMALGEKDMKRLLEYLSIVQVGYILIGGANGSVNGASATLYCLMPFLLTNLTAFGVVTLINQKMGTSEISVFAGLNRRSPALAFLMLISVLSLAGIPPLGGFVGRFLVFAAVIQKGMAWLVFIAVINAIITLYYSLSIVKVMYYLEGNEKHLLLNKCGAAVLIVCAVGIVISGIWISPVYTISYQMSLNLLNLP
jgi:NADH-quinone oxidoreductase subunit N